VSDAPAPPGWWLASDGRWYPPEQHPDARALRPPPGAAWGGPAAGAAPTGSPAEWPPADPGTAPPVRSNRARWIALAAAALVVAVGAGAALLATSGRSSTAAVPAAGQTVLERLSVQPADVARSVRVGLIPGGNQVARQVTLDLCSPPAVYPSEALRVARHQVAAVDRARRQALSTEAVQYGAAQDTTQVFDELRQAAANCPTTFVAPPGSGTPPVRTVFAAAPDAAWPAPPAGVQRLAFDQTQSDQQGDHSRSIAVYLCRGPYLLGIYFADASRPPLAVDGRTSVESIVELFEQRLAAAPLGQST